MPNPEIKILRDELSKVIPEIQKMRVLNEKLTRALGCRLQHTAGEMHVSLSKSPHIKMDETPIRIGGRRRYVWAYIGDAVVLIKMGLEE